MAADAADSLADWYAEGPSIAIVLLPRPGMRVPGWIEKWRFRYSTRSLARRCCETATAFSGKLENRLPSHTTRSKHSHLTFNMAVYSLRPTQSRNRAKA